jgi:sulfatase maturation enzyme AslB (radical SAM superfamily)
MLFCPLPWIFQAVRNNGDIRVCCQANQGPDRGLIRKTDGTVYNAAFDDLVEARNAQKMKDIRKAMINNTWHPDCIRCQREEESGIRSRFTYEKELWEHYITSDEAKKKTQPDGSINTNEIPVVYYDLRFGNHCNLKCRSCGPTDSDAWYKDQIEVWGDTYYDTAGKMKIIKLDGKYTVENNIYGWYENEIFWNHMDKEIPNIQHVHMVGGEPLLIKQQFDFLERCIEKGYANKIIIEHNSNITYIPKKAWDIWKHFKAVKIGASIDGIGKVNDYIRYPSRWKTIENNLRKLDEAEGNFHIWLAVTVQALNILYLPEIFEWKMEQNFKRVNIAKWQPIATLHPLHSPDFLNVKVLPIKAKKAISKKFSTYRFKKNNIEAKKLLQHYSNFMFSEDYSKRMYKFWEYNNKLDQIRNQRMKDFLPELEELLHE